MTNPATVVTDDMVSRFLSWNLPADFAPDCYITFDRISAAKNNAVPIGTNLLNAVQARAMLEHVLGGTAPDTRPTTVADTSAPVETKPDAQTEHLSADPIEAEIKAKGLTAPRVTPADIEANIASEYYFTAQNGVDCISYNPIREVDHPLSLLTFCVLVLRNGFTVTGESACASPENFDAELGRKIARANAVQKVWPLMGYALRERLAKEGGAA